MENSNQEIPQRVLGTPLQWRRNQVPKETLEFPALASPEKAAPSVSGEHRHIVPLLAWRNLVLLKPCPEKYPCPWNRGAALLLGCGC